VCGKIPPVWGMQQVCDGFWNPRKPVEALVTADTFRPNSGPGTELSKLLKRFGIEPTPTCQCRAKAAEMDAWGPDECSKPERIEEVLAVMREEAKARGLPFLDVAGRLLIRRAIANAKRAALDAKATVSGERAPDAAAGSPRHD
jgi:hypothetical protein